MPLTLYVDREAWRHHQLCQLEAEPGLVPVAKGNGYGFTVPVLAEAAAGLGVDQLAVGTVEEAAAVLGVFPGDLIVLESCFGTPDPPAADDRIVRTAASVEAVRKLAGHRMIIDCRSSLRRQGLARAELPLAAQALGGESRTGAVAGAWRVEGFSLHFPLRRPPHSDPAAETAGWVEAAVAAGFAPRTLYVSHLDRAEITRLGRAFPAIRFRPRVGTRLWLGAPDAVHARATVLDTVPVQRGDRLGYRQDRARRDGWLVVVSGGTVQGVGLEAPRRLHGIGARGRELLRWGLAAANRTRSPFTWQGRKQWFAEPPHILVSMLYLPRQCEPPEPGQEIPAELRHTMTHFDQVVIR
jgi:hypothetical protein